MDVSKDDNHNFGYFEPENTDPLLGCLEILCNLKQESFSPRKIYSSLPLENDVLTPSLFTRAAKLMHIDCEIKIKALNKISPLTVPIVLLLEDNQACVITKFIDEETVEIIRPEMIDLIETISLNELQKTYSGYAIFQLNLTDYDDRAKNVQKHSRSAWFWTTIWRFRRIYYQVILSAILINVFTLATPLFIMNVYDRVVPNFAVETLWALTAGIVILFAFDLFLRTARAYLVDLAGQKVDILLSSDLFRHVLNIHLSGKPQSAGAFANNIRELDNLREFFTSATITTLVDLPFLLLFIAIIAYIGGAMAWIPLLAVPIVMVATLLFEIPMRKAIESVKMGGAQKHAILTESIAGLESIKVLTAEGQMLKKWENYVKTVSKSAIKSRFFSSLAANVTIYIQQMVTILLVVIGVYAINAGTLTVGGLIACVILSGRALAPLGQITNILSRFSLAKLALNHLSEVMAYPLERPENKKFIQHDYFNGSIEFSDVTFSYPEQPIATLQKLSFKIEAGERVGIIGRVGAGKSTLARLINGLYKAESGAVLIDGIDINQIDPTDLRHHVGFCDQDGTLFYGTVRENILLGKRNISDQQILEYAQVTGVNQFVSRHPAGFDMRVGEGGRGLSGGQRQSIALMRTLINQPPILILDEPTSSMDTRLEREVVSTIKDKLTNETLLVITHRAYLLSLVDRLIIIDEGKVVADGPKDKIIKKMSNEGNKI